MRCIILTGGIATGKTTVTFLFRRLKTAVVDTDSIGRSLLYRKEVKLALGRYFGAQVFNFQGAINRHYLGEKIFQNSLTRIFLEDLLQPLIRLRAYEIIAKIEQKSIYRKKYYLLSVPLYLRTRYPYFGDDVLVIYSKQALQRQRLVRRGYTKDKIERVLALQPSNQEWFRNGNNLLINQSNLKDLVEKIRDLDFFYSHQ